jgi:hypothetical protein
LDAGQFIGAQGLFALGGAAFGLLIDQTDLGDLRRRLGLIGRSQPVTNQMRL